MITDCRKLFPPILERVEVTRISEGVFETGLLSESAVSRTFSVIKEYIETAISFDSKSFIFSTSPLRLAKNPELLTNRIINLDVPFEIISGKKEAFLNYLILKSYFKNFKIAFDLGGGSTEFIYNSHPPKFNSLNFGCVKYQILHENAPDELKEIINSSIIDMGNSFESKKIIGIGGTATTLLSISMKLASFDSKKIQGASVSFNNLSNIYKKLCSTSLEERKKIPGMDEKRADLLPAGCFIVLEIMKKFKAETLISSHLDLMYGYALEKCKDF